MPDSNLESVRSPVRKDVSRPPGVGFIYLAVSMRKFRLSLELLEDDTRIYKSGVGVLLDPQADAQLDLWYIVNMLSGLYRHEYGKRMGKGAPWPAWENIKRLPENTDVNFKNYPDVGAKWKAALTAQAEFSKALMQMIEDLKKEDKNEQADPSTDRQAPEVGSKAHRES